MADTWCEEQLCAFPWNFLSQTQLCKLQQIKAKGWCIPVLLLWKLEQKEGKWLCHSHTEGLWQDTGLVLAGTKLAFCACSRSNMINLSSGSQSF